MTDKNCSLLLLVVCLVDVGRRIQDTNNGLNWSMFRTIALNLSHVVFFRKRFSERRPLEDGRKKLHMGLTTN